MIKQLRANGKSSYDDFDIYIKERNPSMPSKIINRQSVPGMNGSYDFSELYGEVIFKDRTVEYKFDITGWDVEDLDNERRKVFDWIINIHEVEIFDDYSPNYHWFGSYSDGSWKEDAEQGLLSVKFVVYPFAISNNPIELNLKSVPEKQKVIIQNNSSHRIVPKIITSNQINIEIDDKKVSLNKGEWEINNYYLQKGENELVISGNADVCIKYYEEVF